jgi:DNA end-binding protein Ku
MAPRAFWTGHLRLSLVNIPVKLYPATTAERSIAFHQIHEPTGKRIRYQKIAPGVGPGRERRDHQGLRVREGKYVLIDPKEIDDLKLESKQTIELVRFVDENDIDARYYETPYYLLPDGEMADEGYVIVQKALKDTGKIGSRPIHSARPRQHRRHQALRQRADPRSAAACERDPRR